LSARLVDIRNSGAGKKPRFMGDDASTVDGARYETISRLGNSVTVVISRAVDPVGPRPRQPGAVDQNTKQWRVREASMAAFTRDGWQRRSGPKQMPDARGKPVRS
jgi:hypothetical protein